jgi:hypothetical protein
MQFWGLGRGNPALLKSAAPCGKPKREVVVTGMRWKQNRVDWEYQAAAVAAAAAAAAAAVVAAVVKPGPHACLLIEAARLESRRSGAATGAIKRYSFQAETVHAAEALFGQWQAPLLRAAAAAAAAVAAAAMVAILASLALTKKWDPEEQDSPWLFGVLVLAADGQELRLEVCQVSCVRYVKEQLEEELGVAAYLQRLYGEEGELGNQALLCDCGVRVELDRSSSSWRATRVNSACGR